MIRSILINVTVIRGHSLGESLYARLIVELINERDQTHQDRSGIPMNPPMILHCSHLSWFMSFYDPFIRMFRRFVTNTCNPASRLEAIQNRFRDIHRSFGTFPTEMYSFRSGVHVRSNRCRYFFQPIAFMIIFRLEYKPYVDHIVVTFTRIFSVG